MVVKHCITLHYTPLLIFSYVVQGSAEVPVKSSDTVGREGGDMSGCPPKSVVLFRGR